jgi:hypothetical protein
MTTGAKTRIAEQSGIGWTQMNIPFTQARFVASTLWPDARIEIPWQERWSVD